MSTRILRYPIFKPKWNHSIQPGSRGLPVALQVGLPVSRSDNRTLVQQWLVGWLVRWLVVETRRFQIFTLSGRRSNTWIFWTHPADPQDAEHLVGTGARKDEGLWPVNDCISGHVVGPWTLSWCRYCQYMRCSCRQWIFLWKFTCKMHFYMFTRWYFIIHAHVVYTHTHTHMYEL